MLSVEMCLRSQALAVSSSFLYPPYIRKKFRTTCGPARAESQKGNPQTLYCTDEGECPSHELRTAGILIFFTASTTSPDTKNICGENICVENICGEIICGENRDGYIQKGLEIT